MHPEIRSEHSGKCPKCGMQLVSTDIPINPSDHLDKGLGVLSVANYIPLVVIISLLFAGTTVLALNDHQAGTFAISKSINYFMTGFFLVFAGFKLMDLKGFAHGYSTYDLLAQRVFGYGYVYPFIELSFGLLMLGGIQHEWLLGTEVFVMGFSGLGVVRKLMRKESIQCVCLGTFLKVPLTNITLIEDFGMAFLALVLLVI